MAGGCLSIGFLRRTSSDIGPPATGVQSRVGDGKNFVERNFENWMIEHWLHDRFQVSFLEQEIQLVYELILTSQDRDHH